MDQPKRQLKIDLSELELAFEQHDFVTLSAYYLDLDTGLLLTFPIRA